MGIFTKLKEGLKKTSLRISDSIAAVVGAVRLDDQSLEQLEAALLSADLGPSFVGELLETVRRGPKDVTEIKVRLASVIEKVFIDSQRVSVGDWVNSPVTEKPQIILVSGVNGAGKTTSCGKLAGLWAQRREKIKLVGADTFRAAAGEQLERWAKKAGVDIFQAGHGVEPAAVAYEAIQQAKAEGVDRVLIDTAGRLQAREGLMRELAKVVRVCGKAMPGAPQQGLLVLDGTSGQNMIGQVREFSNVAPPTGLIITKLDGTAKAGALVSIVKEFSIPVLFIGVGEQLEDLQRFDAHSFAEALVGLS